MEAEAALPQRDNFRQLIETVLKPTEARRRRINDDLNEKLKEYEAVHGTVTALLDNHDKPYKMLSDVGAGFKMKARVDEPTKSGIFLHVGLGYYPNFTLPEAKSFLEGQIANLKR
jgi:prefoldin subunit 5